MPRKKKGKAAGGFNGKTTAYAAEHDPVHPRGHGQPAPRTNGKLPRQFTLEEEARNTERHHPWNLDLKLRHAQVRFVSATEAQSKEPRDLHASMRPASFSATDRPKTSGKDLPKPYVGEVILRTPISVPVPVRTVDISSPPVDCVDGVAKDGKMGIQHADKMDAIDDLFITDTSGFLDVVQTGLPSPLVRRSPSPTGSNSSEEIIVFSGRARSQRRRSEVLGKTYSAKFEAKCSKPDILVPIRPAIFTPLTSTYASKSTVSNIIPSFPVPSTKRSASIADSHLRTRNPREAGISKPSPRHKKRSKGLRNKQDEKEVLADYIANIHTCEWTEESTASSLGGRELGGSDNNLWEDEADTSSMDVKSERLLGNDMEANWSERDLYDFDELSTSNEILGEISHVLSKRERPSGSQYLIVCEGYTFDDARWIPSSSLDTPRAQEKVILFDKSVELLKQYPSSSRATDNASNLGDLAALDLEDALDDLRDEEDLLKRKQDRMTDEQIARLLSKQEQLGLGADEVVLFDGNEGSEITDMDGFDILRNDAMGLSTTGRRRRRRRPDDFDHAGVFADALDQDSYGDFDIMDQNRPSFRRKPKDHRTIIPFELSDTELANTMNVNCEKDREKKKIRKLEREELRAQGLLSKKYKVDMKAKYPEGMSYGDIKSEVKNFMSSASESIPLPPMHKKDRKLVHDIANVFKLKSKSVGGGNSRFPVLYKTSRSIQYSEDMILRVETQLSRKRFFPRMDKRGKAGPGTYKTAARGRGSGGAGTAASYRDGEIVGGTAPELGTENRGRAMLEKMGWSSGTALGALNNKGIMQPIVHIVKTTKAGLG